MHCLRLGLHLWKIEGIELHSWQMQWYRLEKWYVWRLSLGICNCGKRPDPSLALHSRWEVGVLWPFHQAWGRWGNSRADLLRLSDLPRQAVPHVRNNPRLAGHSLPWRRFPSDLEEESMLSRDNNPEMLCKLHCSGRSRRQYLHLEPQHLDSVQRSFTIFQQDESVLLSQWAVYWWGRDWRSGCHLLGSLLCQFGW